MNENPDFDRLLEKAQILCRLIEMSGHTPVGPQELAFALAELLSAALRLPVTEEALAEIPKADFGGARAYETARRALGKEVKYWVAYRPFSQGGEIVEGDLADDLADIYNAAREIIYLYEMGAARPSIMESARVMFSTHWGRHLVHALTPLFELSRPLDEEV